LPVEPVEPVKKGKMSDIIRLTGKRANGQRAQPLTLGHFEAIRIPALSIETLLKYS